MDHKKHVLYDSKPKYLIWTLRFIKQYNIEYIITELFSTDEKTIQNFTRTFINLLSQMELQIGLIIMNEVSDLCYF